MYSKKDLKVIHYEPKNGFQMLKKKNYTDDAENCNDIKQFVFTVNVIHTVYGQ